MNILFALLAILKWLVIILAVIALGVAVFTRFAPVFGGKPTADTLARIQASKHFDGKRFNNLEQIHAATIDIDTLSHAPADSTNVLWQFLFPPEGKNPLKPIETVPLNRTQLQTLNDGEFVWLGHSSVLFHTSGQTIITDPVFHRASPIPVGGKPFAMTHTPKAVDLPDIDIVLISHDHYDHLDHRAISQLQGKVKHFYVPLGVKAHLTRWGVPEAKVSEFDWYESVSVGNVQLHFLPTRHFSGRGITGHRTTLWGSWAAISPALKVYFSGDGGYSGEFSKIGARFGGFDVAFVEDGAYNQNWREVHMLPEESAQAAIDLQTNVVLPIHWGKFDLSTHHWREPVRRIKDAIKKHNANQSNDDAIKIATPRIGQIFNLNELPQQAWWED